MADVTIHGLRRYTWSIISWLIFARACQRFLKVILRISSFMVEAATGQKANVWKDIPFLIYVAYADGFSSYEVFDRKSAYLTYLIRPSIYIMYAGHPIHRLRWQSTYVYVRPLIISPCILLRSYIKVDTVRSFFSSFQRS